MTTRHLVLLDAHALTLYVWQRAQLTLVQQFAPGEAGQAAWLAWLQAHPDCELLWLANLAEEGFHVETLPYLRGRDRDTVLARKLAQHFFNTPLTLAQSLGHLHGHRKEERVLLAALTQPALLEPWLNAMRNARTPLAGIYTLPQLTGRLCRLLELPADSCLLLTLHPHGLRESLVMGGEAVFSRLTPLPDSSIAGMAASIASEAHKLHQYLCSQRYIARDEVLTVCPLVPRQARAAVEAACPDIGPLRFRIADLEAAAQRIGLATPPTAVYADLLFLHLLATRRPRQQFAPAPWRHAHRIARLRYGLVAGGLTILCAGLLWLGREILIAHQLRAETAHMATLAARQHAEFARLAQQLPGPAQDPETLRQLLADYDALRRQQDTPCRAMRALSHALDAAPAVRLERLHWECDRQRSSLEVEGSLPATEPRLLRQHFEQLMRALAAHGIRADILTHPIDIASDKPLRGGDFEPSETSPPVFKLRLYWEDRP